MGGSAPRSDPSIGTAATKAAQTGADMLDWMKGQAAITNNWATEDRARYQDKFVPMQNQFIREAKAYDSPERADAAASAAQADIKQQAALAHGTRIRQAMAMGVNPMSGRFIDAGAKAKTQTALAAAGAGNLERLRVEDTGRNLRASAINMGNGMAVNPGVSMGLSNNAGGQGFSGAMQGYGTQANILNQDFQNRMATYNANGSAMGAIGNAVGTVAGMLPFASSEKIKENKQPFDALGAIEQMPVEQWDYKPGAGDGGTHIGPYAEDFQAATGIGDGKSIDPISLVGMTVGAVRQLAEELDEIKAALGKISPMGALPDEASEGDDSEENPATDPQNENEASEMPDPNEAMGAIPMPVRKKRPIEQRMAA